MDVWLLIDNYRRRWSKTECHGESNDIRSSLLGWGVPIHSWRDANNLLWMDGICLLAKETNILNAVVEKHLS